MMVASLDVPLTTLSREKVPGWLWWPPCYPVLGQKMGGPAASWSEVLGAPQTDPFLLGLDAEGCFSKKHSNLIFS